jgi:hypothetical protein
MGPTGQTKTSYTTVTGTRITMASTPGYGTLDAAQARMPADRKRSQKESDKRHSRRASAHHRTLLSISGTPTPRVDGGLPSHLSSRHGGRRPLHHIVLVVYLTESARASPREQHPFVDRLQVHLHGKLSGHVRAPLGILGSQGLQAESRRNST